MPRLTLNDMTKPALMQLLGLFKNEAIFKATEYIENEQHTGWDNPDELASWETKLDTLITNRDWVGAALVLCIIWNLDYTE